MGRFIAKHRSIAGAAVAIVVCLRSPVAADADDRFRREFRNGPVTLALEFSSREVLVAQPLSVRIEAIAPEDVDVTLPKLDSNWGDFSIVSTREVRDVPMEGSRRARIAEFKLESLLSGTYELPAAVATFQMPTFPRSDISGDGDAPMRGTVSSEPISIRVRSLLREGETEEEIRDIKGVAPLPAGTGSSLPAWAWVSSIAASVLALIATVFWFRRRRPPPVLPLVLAEVDRIESGINDGSIDKASAYTRLGDALRSYLESELARPMLARSNPEVLEELKSSGLLDRRAESLLQSFFTEADRCKFAGVADAGEASVEHARSAILLIADRTTNMSTERSSTERASRAMSSTEKSPERVGEGI